MLPLDWGLGHLGEVDEVVDVGDLHKPVRSATGERLQQEYSRQIASATYLLIVVDNVDNVLDVVVHDLCVDHLHLQ